MNKHFKRLIACLLTAAMTVPTAVSLTEPLQGSAYELLGESTFTYKMYPWTPVEISPAKQYFDLDEGAAHMTVIVPEGEDSSQWDLQFRHRNLDFQKGHEYKVSFKVKAKREGMELCSYIGDIRGTERYFDLDGATGDMHLGHTFGGQWGRVVELTTEYTEYSGTFIPPQDITGAEWTFRYALDTGGFGGNAMAGDEIWFDDISIEDLTDPEYIPPVQTYGYVSRSISGLDQNFISVNQVGYFPDLAKHATLSDNQGDFTDSVLPNVQKIELSGSYDYEIVNIRDDSVAYTGKTGKAVKDANSGDTVCRIDFTGFREPGEYYIRIKDQEWRSFPFRIGTDIYEEAGHSLLTNALNYFYLNRAGTSIESKYILSGDPAMISHKENYDEAFGIVQTDWLRTAMASVEDAETNGSSEINTSGGWYTGADSDKYMTEGGIAVWTLQNLYERAAQSETGKEKFADNSGTVVVPESGNQYPDILDECRYELDYMSKMKVLPEEETWGEYAGLYYHRIQGYGYGPYAMDYEHEHHSVYAVQPPSFAATLNYAACAAQGARLWAAYDPDYAAELLTAAKEAYQAFQSFRYAPSDNENDIAQSRYAPKYQYGIHIPDNDTEILDDAYWAACELFVTAKTMEDADADLYFADLSGYENAFRVTDRITGGNNESGKGSNTVFNSGNTGTAGSLTLMLHKDLLSTEQTKQLYESILNTADAFLQTENKQGYGIPYLGDGPGFDDPMGITIPKVGYEYGSNERVLNNMIAMAYAYDLTAETKYLNGVTAGMDYLLGNNPMAFSFITGYGSYSAKNPANRFWHNDSDPDLPQAPDGVLVSGPNIGLQDPYIRTLGFSADYSDNASQRYYADSSEAWSANTASVSTNASLAWILSFMAVPSETDPIVFEPIAINALPGDVTCDDTVDVSDAVLLAKYLAEDESALITDDGKVNADANTDGNITSDDVITILKKIARLI